MKNHQNCLHQPIWTLIYKIFRDLNPLLRESTFPSIRMSQNRFLNATFDIQKFVEIQKSLKGLLNADIRKISFFWVKFSILKSLFWII